MSIVAWALANWRILVFGMVVLILGIQTGRLALAQREVATLKNEFAAFKGGVAALGEKAKADALAKQTADKERKDKADAENKRTADALRADIERLRLERDRANRRLLPAAPSGSKCPEGQACFDRAELEREIRGRMDEVRAELRKLVDEGSAVTIDLDTAKRWAN